MKLPLSSQFIRGIRAASVERYRQELEDLAARTRGGFTKKQIGDLTAGFKDGMTAFLNHLIAAELVTVIRDEEENP